MEVFGEALAKDSSEEREAYLQTACGRDAALHRQVEILLRAHTKMGAFLASPADDSSTASLGARLASRATDFSLERTGVMIGRYKLLQEIGEGGFGQVFMAEQFEPVHRKVALKIIKAGLDTREVVARFEMERQALALMDHPNIARVLDAGATAAGRPYFVMELVRGLPITDYCDRHNLPVPQRLELFMQVCQAVQHAHQKAVLHRDLKPGNILVVLIDGKPVPKIIDFGVAKALGQKLTEKTVFTTFEMIIGTPAYMSPEQAELSDMDVDTRSDIYSLGVLLYELLTGVTPFDAEMLHKAALDEVRRIIRETEPPKPSTRLRMLGDKIVEVAQQRHIDPSALPRLVHGDLDWIVMKALEKDPTRRYETAGGLVEDLQRHLDHQPVLANPPSTAYRTRKFIRRHRAGVALAASVTAALVVGLVVSVIGFAAARHERDRAVTAEEQGKQERDRAVIAEQQAVAERDHAMVAEQQAEQERDHAELLAAEAALERGQSKLEAGDSWGLLDLVGAFGRAEHNPAFQKTVGRRWATWQAEWDQRTIAVRPLHGTPSPDHLRSVSVSGSAVELWDTLTGNPLAGPLKHGSVVRAAEFSADGGLLATVTEEGVIHLWHCADGRPFRPPCKTGIVKLNALSFSTCGRYLVAFSAEHTGLQTTKVAVLRLKEPQGTAHVLEHRYPVGGARFSSDGELLAVSCKPDLQLWRTADFRPAGPPLAVTMNHVVNFSDDGARLAFDPQGSGGIALLDTRAMRTSEILPRPDCTKIGFSHDGCLLAVFGWDCNLELWKTDSGREPSVSQRFGARMSGGFAFNRDDSLLAAGEVSGKIWVLRSSDGQVVQTLHTARRPEPAFLRNGVLASHAASVIHFWDLTASPLPGSTLQHDALAYSLAFDNSGTFLAVGSEDELRLWRMRPWTGLEHVVSMPGRVLALTFSDVEGRFVAFCNDGSLTRVQPRTGKTVTSENFAYGYESSAYVSPDARKLVLIFPRLTWPLIIDTRTGTSCWLDQARGARSAAFAHDSQRMAIGTAGWNVCLFDTSTKAAALVRDSSFEGWVEGAAYRPSDALLAVCVSGLAIHLYEPEGDNRIFSTYEPSLGSIDLIRFSPDGSLLAAAGSRSDGGYGVELWHVDERRGLCHASATLPCAHAVWCLAFSPDNRTLVAGGLGSTRLWTLPPKPKDLGEVQSRTWATLGFRMDENQRPVYLTPSTNGVDKVRAQLTQQPPSGVTPLDTGLDRPTAEALAALQQLAERYPGANVYQRLLGRLHADLIAVNAEQRLWAEALAQADEAIRLRHDDPYTRYQRSLLCLAAEDVAGYRATCRDMMQRFGSSNDPAILKWISWSASLAPAALDDYEDLVEKLWLSASRAGGVAEAYRFYLGALLVRAARYAEAVIELEQVDRLLKAKGAYVSFSPTYNKFLLAICHARLGHRDAARQWSDAAARDVQNLLQPGQGGQSAANAVPWNRQLTLELLQKEAEALLNAVALETAVNE